MRNSKKGFRASDQLQSCENCRIAAKRRRETKDMEETAKEARLRYLHQRDAMRYAYRRYINTLRTTVKRETAFMDDVEFVDITSVLSIIERVRARERGARKIIKVVVSEELLNKQEPLQFFPGEKLNDVVQDVVTADFEGRFESRYEALGVMLNSSERAIGRLARWAESKVLSKQQVKQGGNWKLVVGWKQAVVIDILSDVLGELELVGHEAAPALEQR